MKKLFSYKYTDNVISFALLLLRFTMGGLMIPHGYQKLTKFASLATRFSDPLHIGSTTTLILVIFAEFFCAIFIILGLFTRLASIPLIIGMSFAVFYAHKGDIFGEGKVATMFLGGFLTLLFAGPGKVSMDRLISK